MQSNSEIYELRGAKMLITSVSVWSVRLQVQYGTTVIYEKKNDTATFSEMIRGMQCRTSLILDSLPYASGIAVLKCSVVVAQTTCHVS